MSNSLFTITRESDHWVIEHNESGKKIGINFNAIPADSSDDFVQGYAKCLAYQEGWIS